MEVLASTISSPSQRPSVTTLGYVVITVFLNLLFNTALRRRYRIIGSGLETRYSEGSTFWRESKRWRYAGPSSLYCVDAPLSRISHSCARLLPSFLAI
jgi:hypothetical protein